jgi:hypothetical protein
MIPSSVPSFPTFLRVMMRGLPFALLLVVELVKSVHRLENGGPRARFLVSKSAFSSRYVKILRAEVVLFCY